VLVANDVTVLVDDRDGYTPTPAVSHAIIRANVGKSRAGRRHRGHPVAQPAVRRRVQVQPAPRRPADTDATSVIAARANELIRAGSTTCGARRSPGPERPRSYDFLGTYVDDLPRSRPRRDPAAGVRIGADPLGGASVATGRDRRAARLDLTVVNPLVDPTWRFMTLDWDGKIRMDCSSPSAMASLIGRKDDYDIATGNDADADRHGIVTPDAGLMNPNHFLAVAIGYLFGGGRPTGPASARIGKTLVSSVDDRPGRDGAGQADGRGAGRLQVVRARLIDGSFGFGGEESAARRSCAGRHAPGPPTRTACSSRCSPRRSSPPPAGPPAALRRPRRAARRPGLRPDRRARRPVAEGQARRPVTGRREGHRARRGGDHRQADRGARQPREDRRPQGGHRLGLVRRPSVRHEDVYKIYAESFRGARPSAPGPGRGTRGRSRLRLGD
jgi:phosphoglucomutase